MNKRILIAALIVVLCVLSFLLIRNMLLPKEEIILDQANKTFIVKGDVKIKGPEDGAKWRKMDSSTILKKGDTVETAGDSTVDIIIGDNTDKAVKLEEKSRVEFQGINPAYLNFSKGKIRVTLKKLEPKSSFIVKTPIAICGARGTAWLEEASADKTKISVFESNVYICGIDDRGRPNTKKYITSEGTERDVEKGRRVSEARKISENDLMDWQRWGKSIEFLRQGKVLVDDFDIKENFNNLKGPLGSWNVFYSDPNQYCRDEFTDLERVGDKGYSLKLTYDVDSPFSAYNGFFTYLMDIDLSGYKYLVFYIKGDKKAGFTEKLNLELKNDKKQVGRLFIEGITDEWKKMVIPLGQFTGINDFKDMKEFVIVFSDIGVTKKEGVIYIDDIYFSKAEPGVK
ncbi:MAG: FecR domain-containing protein [Candidatus Omnitrophica bacterium]|nr:FecR domain-containing protein [Candidatus Omnitrophota bacterium]